MCDEATAPGATLADAFADCRRFFAEAGYPDEWHLHHQAIQVGRAFAWTPSITGAKSEETFLLTPDGPRVVAA